MHELPLHQWHQTQGARFRALHNCEIVSDYGERLIEHTSLCDSAGVLDLSFRSRLCLTGADRQRFLHGQVTNDINRLSVGQGCYAALITAKGKMVSDLNIYRLTDEFLLDFEPGLSVAVRERLEKYIIADDVQVVDVAKPYGHLSVQGPNAPEALQRAGWRIEGLAQSMSFISTVEQSGEIYVMNQPRTGSRGYDLFVPSAGLVETADRLLRATQEMGGRLCGWDALETARIEAGIPRFGVDMDESNLPPEAGLDERAISYTKGCYIGQEIIARIRTYGQVAKALRGLRFEQSAPLPIRGDRLFRDGKEAGLITSAVASPRLRANIALGYVRREYNQIGNELTVRTEAEESSARIVDLPFGPL